MQSLADTINHFEKWKLLFGFAVGCHTAISKQAVPKIPCQCVGELSPRNDFPHPGKPHIVGIAISWYVN
jgi:hypothetical protein